MPPADPLLGYPPPVAGPPAETTLAPTALADLEPLVVPPVKKRRRIGWIITVILLSLALLAAVALFALTYLRLEDARKTIKEQEDLIDQKETFSLAMQELMSTVGQFDGLRFGEDLVPSNEHESLANRGWDHRWNSNALAADTAAVRKATDELAAVLVTAKDGAAVNASGSTFEAVLDQLGLGYVTSVIDDTHSLCGAQALGCVMGNDPYTVHFDASDNVQPWMTDFIRTGIAYHEFAHVLQITNPEATDVAAEAFGGDIETMADCFSLAYVDGWTLDHTVWVSDFEYWEISVGYGYTCDETQRQVVRDWYEQLVYHPEPLAQRD